MDVERYLDRIADRFDIDPETGCWVWTRCVDRAGFSKMGIGGQGVPPVNVHRWLYEHVVEPIEPGMRLKPLCGNRACINPDHWEPVSPKATHCRNGHELTPENVYVNAKGGRTCRVCRVTGVGRGGQQRLKTHCPKGHPYDDENTYWRDNRRRCVICSFAARRSWKQKRREGR